jgi:HAD superfamily hydrolase (TIGR01509 family)
MAIGCIVFDIGGVLVELKGISTMLSWMRNPCDEPGLWRAWLGSPTVRDYERGRIDTGSFAAGVVAEFDLTVTAEQFIAGFTDWPSRPLPGAHDLLRDVRAGVMRATLSNSNALHWTRIMHEMAFEPHFDHHFASHLIDRIKPDQDVFAHVIEAVGVRPDEILFVDDNAINVDAARRCGLTAFRCVGPGEVRTRLAAAGLLTSSGA